MSYKIIDSVRRQQHTLCLLVMLLSLVSCTGDRCIEADDFGHSIFPVEARYDKASLSEQVGMNQVAPWRDSGYRVNGRPLTIVIKSWANGIEANNPEELSAWSPWYGTSQDGRKLANFCTRFATCKFMGDVMCSRGADAKIVNAPCLMKDGVGLYALIAAKNIDPNQSLDSQRRPQGITFHLGEKQQNYTLYDIDKRGQTREVGGRVFTYDSSNHNQYSDSKLYFKILDKFYDDNSGQYRVVVKSGISRDDPDPIAYVTTLVKNFLFGVNQEYGLIKNIYTGIIKNPGYRLAVTALLTLYIIYTALLYLAGNLQITQTELILRMCKVALVSALLSNQYSWQFFNEYLFVYFVGGMEQILKMITEAGATGPGSPGILALMLAPQTISKLLSLLFVDWLGVIYIILFLIALAFILVTFFRATVIYLTALITIGMIIVTGPIFICFMLFGVTKPLFENWLKQLISYAVQPIILFTGLIFISMILRQEIYGALGFRVCKQAFPKMMGSDGKSIFNDQVHNDLDLDSIFYWWFPQPMKGSQFTKATKAIPIPIDHFASDEIVAQADANGFCEAYGCIGQRYIDLPFLDPNKDMRRINQFWNGNFVQLDGLLLIFVAIYLLNKFNSLTIAIARFITSSSGNASNLNNVGDAVHMQTVTKANQLALQGATIMKQKGVAKVMQLIDHTIGRRALHAANTDLSALSEQEKSAKAEQAGREIRNTLLAQMENYTPSALIDRLRVNQLKKEALTSSANQAVLDEVKKSTGLERTNITKGAKIAYQKRLAQLLSKKADAGALAATQPDKEVMKIAKRLSTKDFAKVKHELAKLKFGKEYDQVSATEQKIIDQEHKSLRELAIDSAAETRFQEAYVDAYIALSNRGVGLFGKHSKILRTVEEINHAGQERRQLEQRQQSQFGTEILSEYDKLKSVGYKMVFGKRAELVRQAVEGPSWHEIDISKSTNNYRKQTYAEQMQDEKHNINRSMWEQSLRNHSTRYGMNAISPEGLARAVQTQHPDLATFRELAKQDVEFKVYQALSSSEDPALLGATYLAKYAKDSEMRHAIDRAYTLGETLQQQDEFIKSANDYQLRYEVATDHISEAYQVLSVQYKPEEITSENILSLFTQHVQQENKRTSITDSSHDVSQSQQPKTQVQAVAQDEGLTVAQLKRSLKDFNNSQYILQQIDIRKQDIVDEVNKHVENINQYRKNSLMDEYKGKGIKGIEPREHKLRTIEDHLRTLKESGNTG